MANISYIVISLFNSLLISSSVTLLRMYFDIPLNSQHKQIYKYLSLTQVNIIGSI